MATPNVVDIAREVQKAQKRLTGRVRRTPTRRSRYLSKVIEGEVFLKLENLQVTSSFKVRGALNKLASLEGTDAHVVAASTGNHALAVAHACTTLGLTCTLYLPKSANRHKVQALKQYPATLRFVAGDAVQAEYEARRTAQLQDQVFVSPYNDPAVIGGQGTVGTELLSQVSEIDSILVAVGGGGLISGIAAAVRHKNLQIRMVGCSPEASPVMHESVHDGHIVTRPSLPTLSDGTAGGLEEDAVTFPLCQTLVEDWLLVNEQQIANALKVLYNRDSLVVEGAAGVGVAALLKHTPHFTGQRVAVILCGANVDPEVFQTITASS